MGGSSSEAVAQLYASYFGDAQVVSLEIPAAQLAEHLEIELAMHLRHINEAPALKVERPDYPLSKHETRYISQAARHHQHQAKQKLKQYRKK